jgi:hypothetical protein
MKFDLRLTNSHYERAGMLGFYIALKALPDQGIFTWETTPATITVEWEGSFRDAWGYLLEETFKLKDGIIWLAPEKEPFVFQHLGMCETLLSNPKLNRKQKEKNFHYGGMDYTVKNLVRYPHQDALQQLTDKKGKPLDSCPGGLWLHPGTTQEDSLDFQMAAMSLFTPLAAAFYEIVDHNGYHPDGDILLWHTYAIILPDMLAIGGFDILETRYLKEKHHKPRLPEELMGSGLQDAIQHFAFFNRCDSVGLQFNDPGELVEVLEGSDNPVYETIRECFPNHLQSNPFTGRRKADVNLVRCKAVENMLRGVRYNTDLGREPTRPNWLKPSQD